MNTRRLWCAFCLFPIIFYVRRVRAQNTTMVAGLISTLITKYRVLVISGSLMLLVLFSVLLAAAVILVVIIVRRQAHKRKIKRLPRVNEQEIIMVHNGTACAIARDSNRDRLSVCSLRELDRHTDLLCTPTPRDPNASYKSSIDQYESLYSSLQFERDFIVPSSDQRKSRSVSDENEVEHLYIEVVVHEDTPCFMYDDNREVLRPQDSIDWIYALMSDRRYREISRNDLELELELGRGNFAIVHSGIWKTLKGDIPVAIKSLKMEAEESNISFLQEAVILGQFNHPNVLKLLGVVTLSKPIIMVTELMHTELKDFLRSILKKSIIQFVVFGPMFLRFTQDIALGMEYLARKRFVHRDLSARNILLTQDLVCKIGDFGLARMLGGDDEYERGSDENVPIKWTPPEAIFYKKYSEKSDVWSYGVTLYEVWTVGQSPWKNYKIEQVIENVSQGIVLFPPSGCPRDVYELMVKCWHPDKEFRPLFSDIVSTIHNKGEELIKRGRNPEEMLDLGLVPTASKNLFVALQKAYLNSIP